MNRALVFGQFMPGDTPVHRTDPRAKLAVIAAITVALFGSSGWAGLGLVALIVIGAYALSHVPFRSALRGIRPILLLLVFVLIVHSFGREPGGALWRIAFSPDGFLRGLYFSIRIILLIASTSLLTYTTSPVAMTDAVVSLLRPLGRIGVPVEDIAMMFSIALRFIPTTAEDAERIMVAQSARGARFDTGGPFVRMRAFSTILIPLFVSLFRRADDLAVAMESRGYTGVGRTRLAEMRFKANDAAIVVAAFAVASIVVVFG